MSQGAVFVGVGRAAANAASTETETQKADDNGAIFCTASQRQSRDEEKKRREDAEKMAQDGGDGVGKNSDRLSEDY